MLQKESCRDFPCGPEVKTLCFHCRGQWIHSLVGQLQSQMSSFLAKYFLKNNKSDIRKRTLHYKGRTGQMDEAKSRSIFEAQRPQLSPEVPMFM